MNVMREGFGRWALGFRLAPVSVMRRGAVALALSLGVLTVGCGKDATTTTPTTPTGPTTSVFAMAHAGRCGVASLAPRQQAPSR